ncbi:MAG: cation-translocating P-type ATPase [Burkholderiales bacterium]|nr:cation-translocating P-type ATPase [Burkholderiales bacterium]
MDQGKLTLAIEGMTCASCVARVEKAIGRVPGVSGASVNLATESASVTLASSAGQEVEAAVQAAIQRAGYTAHRPAAPGAAASRPWLSPGWRVVGAVALTLPLVLPMLVELVSGTHTMLAPLWQWLLATAVVFGFGSHFFRSGWHALRSGSGHMDLLVSLGTGAAYGLSVVLWLREPAGMPALYFESAAVVITLVLLGQWLESRARRRTLAALDALRALRPDIACVRRADGSEASVPLAQVRVGDIVIVRPGERLPVDGTVIEGRSHIDESLITGESLPRPREPGDPVTGGAINAEGLLALRTRAVGDASLLSQIVRQVEAAQARKAPIQRSVDQVAAVFVPAVAVLAVVTLLGWGLLGDIGWSEALIRAVSVLVIACPCALGLATPVTLIVGLGLAARRGILVRDAQALELMRQVSVVAFDKTGTLTEGRPRVIGCLALDGDETALLAGAAALQAGSEHPLARAVLNAAEGLARPTAQGLHAEPGRGMRGQVDGRELSLGSALWMRELGVDIAEFAAAAAAWSADGASIALLAEAQPAGRPRALGVLAFGDAPKPSAAAAVAGLRAAGLRVLLLSGDNRGAAQSLGRALGIDEVHAELMPADKSRLIDALRQSLPAPGKVAMVGDGVNDAPALAAADVGLAMTRSDGTGTDAAMASAGLTLLRGDPRLVLEALQLSRAITRRIRLNLFWAFAYNAIGLPLAALGVLSPMLAGAAMAMSSLSVVLSALLLARYRPSPDYRSGSAA